MKKGLFLPLLLTLLPLASACALFSTKPDVPELPFEGTVWMLKHLGRTDIANAPTQPFVKFESGSVQGFGGCNRFTGSYTLEKDRLHIKQIVATKMFCQDVDTEQQFLDALQRSARIMLADDKLMIADSEKPILLFKAKPL